MNESYSSKTSFRNQYSSLDSLTELIKDLDTTEAEIFSDLDSIGLSPSIDTMDRIYAFL